MWLQMHADVTQRTVVVGECDNAPLLGCAVLAAAALKHHAAISENISEPSTGAASSSPPPSMSDSVPQLSKRIEECVNKMIRKKTVINPNEAFAEHYDNIYKQYTMLAPALSHIHDSINATSTSTMSPL
jgi:sugar (pentulose or hexulose) kinase